MQTLMMIWALFNQLLPLLVQTVDTVEKAFPQTGQGAQKLEMVKSVLTQAHTTAGELGVAFEQVWPILNAAITSIVALRKINPAQ